MNGQKQYNIIKEPCGKILSEIINYSLNDCDKFILIERTFDESACFRKAMEVLHEFLIKKEKANKWPGTELVSSSSYAIVNYYILNNKSTQILMDLSNRLYDWKYPDLPEDFIILRKDGQPWLVTISHEEDGYFEMNEKEMEIFCSAVEGLNDLISSS